MVDSLLLLSQVQAKAAISLRRVVKLKPNSLQPLLQMDETATAASNEASNERIRAKVRGALETHTAEDISESTFLGNASKSASSTADIVPPASESTRPSGINGNPVDEMMALERELRDMDMALELGSSIVSLDARSQNRAKGMDGSFMVVPPGSGSYMSSSAIWSSPPSVSSGHRAVPTSSGTTGARARANRVQALASSTTRTMNSSLVSPSRPQQHQASSSLPQIQGLDASWLEGSSQVLVSSVASLASSVHVAHQANRSDPMNNSTDTKQLMRLMDSLKTLGDENAALLRQVEEAEAMRLEARMAQEEMRRFKAEYNHRFQSLRDALKRFREEHPSALNEAANSTTSNPVANSEFLRSESAHEKIQRQEQLIRNLTADLKKEKEESKKRDAVLRKYEIFYTEVKARSARKAAERQKGDRQSRA